MKDIKIIAEIGINHNGSYNDAEELIKLVAFEKLYAVKFQYRNLDNIYYKSANEIGDEIISAEIYKNYLSPIEIYNLSKFAKELGLKVGISFFDKSDLKDFEKYISVFDFFKVPSVEFSNLLLIDSLLSQGKYVYLSLGGQNQDEIDRVFSELPKNGWMPFHCVSNYPVNIQNPKLGYISYLKKITEGPVGYSSHDSNWEVCLLAIQQGATIIERHITLDKLSDGLDHSSSSTIDEFRKLALFASNFEHILGGWNPRNPNQGELLNMQNLGRSFYLKNNIEKSRFLKKADLIYRSPKVGLDMSNIEDYLEKPVLSNSSAGLPVVQSMFISEKKISDEVIETSRKIDLSLPVRLHDFEKFEKLFPIGAFEFHLSFQEVMSHIDVSNININNKYSVHLPDYINSTKLIDPFSQDFEQKNQSIKLINRVSEFVEKLQDITGKVVPIVGSFSIANCDKNIFYKNYKHFLNQFKEKNINIYPQWLPPIAWYFGGSIDLSISNNQDDANLIKKNNIDICMDLGHMFLGRNYYNFDEKILLDTLDKNIKHLHISDALGIDGEGFPVGVSGKKNIDLINSLLDKECLKVIEVWQGHLNHGKRFKDELSTLSNIYNNRS